MDPYISFLKQVRQSLEDNALIKLSLGNYKGEETDLKNCYIKPVLIKRVLMLSFVFRYKTRDITKNYSVEDGLVQMELSLGARGFQVVTLFTEEANTVCQLGKSGKWFVKQDKATAKQPATLAHDHQKVRKLDDTGKYYLQALRLTDADGKVFKNAQDKWKQINHYIEILSSMLQDLPAKDTLQVVDMGAGKGYLTFALYDYLQHVLKRKAKVVGVEYRTDLVDLCNQIAKDTAFDGLSFVQGTIEEYQSPATLDVLIALHACDTATDDAIAKGIQCGADLIVVAPCCHKQIRREMEQSKRKNELDFLLQHGIFLERQAEMLTDGLRALIMEYFGYQTKVFQFISDAHTPKNVLVVGIKKAINKERQAEILQKVAETKAYFGIGYHHLERLLGI